MEAFSTLYACEGEERLTAMRVCAVLRDMRLIDPRTLYRLFCRPVDKADKSKGILLPSAPTFVTRCGKAPYRSPAFYATAEEATAAFLRDETVPDARKAALVREIRRTRERQAGHTVAYGLSDAAAGWLISLLFAATVALVCFCAGALLCKALADGYLRLLYTAVFPAYAAIAACSLYWANFPDRLLRKPLPIAAWQTAVVVSITMLVFILLRLILPTPH